MAQKSRLLNNSSLERFAIEKRSSLLDVFVRVNLQFLPTKMLKIYLHFTTVNYKNNYKAINLCLLLLQIRQITIVKSQIIIIIIIYRRYL